MNGSISLVVGHASHTGLVREVNEDSYLVLAPPGVSPPIDALLLVADGVGGTNAGEVASGVLVESFLGWFRGNTYAEQVHYNPGHPDYFIAALKDLLEKVNERLYQMAASRVEWSSMGTTATIALVSNGRLYLGHVGDTRAYLLRGGALQQLTADHSWVAEEVAAGRLTAAQAQEHPRRNVISRVLGASPLLRVDRQAYDVESGDIFVLATDGLTGLVSDAEIRAAVLGGRAPQEACHQLVSLANSRGGHDNVTVIVAQVTAGGSKTVGLGADGTALHSTHLGMAAAPVPAGRAAPRRLKEGGAPPRAARPRRDNSRLGIGLLVFIALTVVGGALAAAAAAAVRAGTVLTLAGWLLAPPLLAAGFTVLALVFGFLVGFLGRQWLAEHRNR